MSKKIILPCAGGCAANYHRYTNCSDVVAYEYPGHWSRYAEPLVENEKDILEELYVDIIQGKYGDNVEILGHSMGGLLAWLLASKLASNGYHVKHLYIAACSEPTISPEFVKAINNDIDIKNTLRVLRQIPERVLRSDFFNENLLPPIRTDFAIVKSLISALQDADIQQIPVDITCFYGVEDPVIQKEDMVGWEKYTSERFRIMDFNGDHFFLYGRENINKIISIMQGI